MGKKSVVLVLFCFILAISIGLVGCMPSDPSDKGSDEEVSQTEKQPEESKEVVDQEEDTSDSDEIDPFGKYPEPIEITTCRVLTSWMGFDEGEDENNNWWSKTYLEQLNIKLNVVWTAPNWGEPLETKITTSIAADDLPDLMPVYGSIAQRLAIADKIIDVKDIVDKYASDKVREYLNVSGGRALQSAMYDGKMIGIPNPGPLDPSYGNLVWYRSDWLEELGLEVPKTLEDIEELARAFMDKHPGTYGIAAHKNFGGSSGNLMMVLNAYDVHEGWIEKDGELQFGQIQPETKDALARLHEWYKEGLLAEDFAIKDPDNELQADIASNKVGIFFSGSHFPNGGAGRALKANNPEADVDWIMAPDIHGGIAKQDATSRANDFNVISKKCEHPEAVMKLINLKAAIFEPAEKPDFLKDIETNIYDSTPGGNMNFWNAVVAFDNIVKNIINARIANEEIAKGGDGSNIPIDARSTFQLMSSWINDGTNAENFENNWALYKLFNAENGSDLTTYDMVKADPDKYLHFDAFAALDTPAIAKYGSDIHNKRIEYFIKAIMEGDVEAQFDAWVNYFHNNGGDEMTREVNDWYQKNK